MIPERSSEVKPHREADLVAFVQGEGSVAAIKQAMHALGSVSYDIHAGNVRDMIKYLVQRSSPRVLIVDITGSELPLSDLNELSEVCDPNVQVIVVGARNDVGLYRDMIRMGIYDYMVTPIVPDILVRSAQAALAGDEKPTSAPSREGKVISFISTRGGSGSTTLATNVAWLLAEEKKRRVVIVDMNLHVGTVSFSFNLKPDHGLREALENPKRVDDVFVDRLLVKVTEKLEIMSSEEPLDSFPEIHFDGFENLIKVLKKKFHFVILDVPRRVSKLTHHWIEKSNVMMVVADPSLSSVRDIDRYYRQFGMEAAGRRVVTILNKSGLYKKGEVSPEDFQNATKRPIHHVLPFDANTPLDCLNKGVILTSVESKLKEPLRAIVSDLTGGMSLESKKGKGLFGSIKSLLSS